MNPAAAVVNGRKGIGVELKPSYFQQAKRNLADVAENGWGSEQRNMLDEMVDEESLESELV